MDLYTLRGFQDELQKIAESTAPEKKKGTGITRDQAMAGGLMAGAGGLAAGGLAASVPNALALGVMRHLSKGKTTPEQAEKLRSVMDPESLVFLHKQTGESPAMHMPASTGLRNLVSSHQGQEVTDYFGKMGIPKEHLQNLGKVRMSVSDPEVDPAVVAHELGHSSAGAGHGGKIVKFIHDLPVGDISAYGGLAATGMAAIADPDSAVSRYAPLVGGLSAIPELLDEGIASYRGYKGMQRAGIPTAGALPQMASAFGSYLTGAPIMNIAGPLVARSIRKHLKRKSIELNEKQRMAESAHAAPGSPGFDPGKTSIY